MDRAYSANAAGTPPSAPGTPSIGYPTAGSPSLGIPATTPGPYWFHQITEEIRQVIVHGGLTPSHADLTQLRQAIMALIMANQTAVPDATTTVKGKVELATNAESVAGSATNLAVTPSGLAAAIAAIALASTTIKGLVELATNAESIAGIATDLAVTPAGLSAALPTAGFGSSHTWQNKLATRQGGVTYQNTTGRPIQLWMACGAGSGYGSDFYIGPSSTLTTNTHMGYVDDGTHYSWIIPPGHYYGGTNAALTVNHWYELRL